MRDLGFAEGYRHAHGEQTDMGAYAPGEDYFPEQMSPQQFYFPQTAGLEGKIKSRLDKLAQLDAAATNRRRTD